MTLESSSQVNQVTDAETTDSVRKSLHKVGGAPALRRYQRGFRYWPGLARWRLWRLLLRGNTQQLNIRLV